MKNERFKRRAKVLKKHAAQRKLLTTDGEWTLEMATRAGLFLFSKRKGARKRLLKMGIANNI